MTNNAQEPDRDALRAEAEQIAKSVRGQFLLLVGVSAFMFVTLNVSDEKLFVGNEDVRLPILDVTTDLSSLIVLGPAVITILLAYWHFAIGRLEELAREGVYAPQIYFFTMRNPVARVFTAFCFYAYVPAISAYFFIRTHSIYRPEAPQLLILLGTTLMVCSILMLVRAVLARSRWRQVPAFMYLALSVGAVAGGAWLYYTDGRAPFQTLSVRLNLVDLENANISALSGGEDLSDFVFDNVCLRAADLSGLDLVNVSFVGADLSEAKLESANLEGADLSAAILTGADLRQANLSAADLSDASMSRLKAEGADFTGADLSGAELGRAGLIRASFENARARGTDFSQAQLTEAVFSGASVSAANFAESQADTTKFIAADAAGASFCLAQLKGANLIRAMLQGADFSRADLTDARFGGADLTGAFFDRAVRAGTDFTNALMPKAGHEPPRHCRAGGRAEHPAPLSPCDRNRARPPSP